MGLARSDAARGTGRRTIAQSMIRTVDQGCPWSSRGSGRLAVSEQSIDQARNRGWGRLLFRFGLFVAAILVGFGVVAAGLAVYHDREAGRILPGVSIAGVDVGGQTADEARAALTSRLAPLSTGGVSVRTSLGSTQIAFADVGRGPDLDTMVTAAVSAGRGGSWLDESIASIRLRLNPIDVPLQLTYDHDRAAALVSGFVDRMALSPVDASVVRGVTSFAVIPGVDGQTVDAAAATAAVDAAMRDPGTPAGTRLAIGLVPVAPALSNDAANDARAAAIRLTRELKVVSGSKSWTI